MARACVSLLHVLFPIFQQHLLFIVHSPSTILRLKKWSDVKHGLGDVLTKAVGVLYVTHKDNDSKKREW